MGRSASTGLRLSEVITMTSDDDMALVHGRCNLFRDLERQNPEARQFTVSLAR